jgi:two-component system OmpR family sensor kinase
LVGVRVADLMNAMFDPVEPVAARELLMVAAHDIRNYLTPVHGRLDLMRRRALREGRTDYLNDSEHATKNLDRLRRLVDDLLDVSRLERGLFEIDRQHVDVASVVREAVEAFTGGETSIQITGEMKLSAYADPARIEQAVGNLLANAIRYSPEAGLVLVDLYRSMRSGRRWVTIRVTDQGAGIAADQMPRLFKCFSSGPGSAGLGLGLYLAHSIARAHRGTLTVQSVLGEGATFLLSWPA